jgi:hypothetical protein
VSRVFEQKDDKLLYIVKTFCSLSPLSKQYDSRRESLFTSINTPRHLVDIKTTITTRRLDRFYHDMFRHAYELNY